MKYIPSIFFKNKKQAWQYWPSCNHPKTLSFRASNDVFKTVNSVFLDTPPDDITPESRSRLFTNSSSSDDFCDNNSSESLETIIRGIRSSDRLFFDPGTNTSSSIVKIEEINEENGDEGGLFKESRVEVVALESEDPYLDFKRSMSEMVESNGLMVKGDHNWDCLEELLRWYLRMNAKNNHVFIIGAFVDLLLDTGNLIMPPTHHPHHNRCDGYCSGSSSMAPCCSDSMTSYSSADSCFSSSPCNSSTLSPTDQRVVGVVIDACDQMGISEDKDFISQSY